MNAFRLPLSAVLSPLDAGLARQALSLLQASLWQWSAQAGLRRDPACLALLGLEGEALDDLGWLDRVHPDDVGPLSQSLHACLAGQSHSMAMEYRILHHDGHYVRIDERACRQDDGTVLGAVRLCEPFHSQLDPSLAVDPLTGLDSRVRFEQRLAEQLLGPRGRDFCLLRFTVDHWAKILLLVGEAQSDDLLVKLVRQIRRDLAAEIPFARWDEDSFILMLPETDRAQGLILAERLRMDIADASLLPARPVTISSGLVQCQADEQLDHLLARLAACHGQARREFNSVVG